MKVKDRELGKADDNKSRGHHVKIKAKDPALLLISEARCLEYGDL